VFRSSLKRNSRNNGMEKKQLQEEIRRLLRERDAILLAHYYQRDEVQQIADIVGDSLALSIEAAKTKARVIVFAGVHFMAESAAILSPEKTVLLPRLDAGCPLADAVTPEALREARKAHPGAAVVTYINSSAAVKALSDICCTSANAVRVVQSVPADEILFVPDGNLARWTARFTDKKIIPWGGACPVHDEVDAGAVARLKREHPDAPLLAHPECPQAVLDLADFVGSTAGILRHARESEAGTMIIGTEQGIFYRLRLENPGKTFLLASPRLLCTDMKVTTLEDIRSSLAENRHVIRVPEETAVAARRALERMTALS
jgi:quinolinate synthase